MPPVVVVPPAGVVVVGTPLLLPEAAEVTGVLPAFVPGRMLESAPFLQHSPAVNLTVVGVNVPQPIVAQVVAPPVQLEALPVPVVVPPPPYVPPVFPPRKDRN